MGVAARLALGVGGVLVVGVLALLYLRRSEVRQFSALEESLLEDSVEQVFTKRLVSDLPEPVRRYFEHAIAPGTPIAQSVRLETLFTMRLREGDEEAVDLVGEEVLASEGFLWRARTKMLGLPVQVQDYYADGAGGVAVTLAGLVPIVRVSGPEVTRSARGRLVGESIWLPSTLLPSESVVWEVVDADLVRVTRRVDGESVSLTLRIDDEGRPLEMSMLRYGDVGVESWQLLPYGVEIEEEATFGGYTIPTRVRGGWWFGSERYSPFEASVFQVLSAAFR